MSFISIHRIFHTFDLIVNPSWVQGRGLSVLFGGVIFRNWRCLRAGCSGPFIGYIGRAQVIFRNGAVYGSIEIGIHYFQRCCNRSHHAQHFRNFVGHLYGGRRCATWVRCHLIWRRKQIIYRWGLTRRLNELIRWWWLSVIVHRQWCHWNIPESRRRFNTANLSIRCSRTIEMIHTTAHASTSRREGPFLGSNGRTNCKNQQHNRYVHNSY